jgi:hypothetical protein
MALITTNGRKRVSAYGSRWTFLESSGKLISHLRSKDGVRWISLEVYWTEIRVSLDQFRPAPLSATENNYAVRVRIERAPQSRESND